MNKAAIALTTVAALAVARVAVAQEAGTDPQDPSAGSAVPAPMPAPADTIDTSITTITSAEPPPSAPASPTGLRERERLVAKQSIRPNRPLLITGLSTFVGSYLTTAALTGVAVMRHHRNADRTMYMPLAGPWLHLRTVHEGTFDTLLIAGSGIIQAAGVAVSILSVFIPEKIPAAVVEARGIKVNLTATSFGRGSAGVGATGEF
jgi:hypothetical protein